MLKIENLTKSYRIKGGRHYVFENVSATFPDDANIGIIGPNGAGKSTFLRILGGIDFPDSGRIVTDRSFSWPLGLKGGFVGHMSGRDNCRMVCNLYGLPGDEIKRKLEQVKALSGIGDYFEEPVDYYSSGMGGRLGFALSMAFDFDYFLIDEITSVGDAHFKALAKQAFAEKTKKSKMIMVSHNMGDIKKFCDIAVLVQGGKIQVYNDMDAAIRAYLPQTKEATDDLAEINRQASLDEINITSVKLSEGQEAAVSEITTRLNDIEQMLRDPRHYISGHNDEFYFRLGSACEALGCERTALEYYKKATELNSHHLRAQQRRAALAATLGLADEVSEAITAAEAIDPLNLFTLKAKQQYLLKQRKFPEALAVSDQALRVAPQNAQLWTQRGAILLAMENMGEALAAQIKAVRYAPDDHRAYQQLATILAAAGDIKASMLARHKALTLEERVKKQPKRPELEPVVKSLRKLDTCVRV